MNSGIKWWRRRELKLDLLLTQNPPKPLQKPVFVAPFIIVLKV